MAKKWIESKAEKAKRGKYRKRAKEIQEGIKKPVAWCDCIGTQDGNYKKVESKDDICVNCGNYVVWDKNKPRPSETTKDVEVHYLEDYITNLPDNFVFDEVYEVEDGDAV